MEQVGMLPRLVSLWVLALLLVLGHTQQPGGGRMAAYVLVAARLIYIYTFINKNQGVSRSTGQEIFPGGLVPNVGWLDALRRKHTGGDPGVLSLENEFLSLA